MPTKSNSRPSRGGSDSRSNSRSSSSPRRSSGSRSSASYGKSSAFSKSKNTGGSSSYKKNSSRPKRSFSSSSSNSEGGLKIIRNSRKKGGSNSNSRPSSFSYKKRSGSGGGNRRGYEGHNPRSRSSNGRSGGRGSNGREGRHGRAEGRSRSGRKMPTFDPSRFIKENPVQEEVKEDIYVPKNTFATFGLDKKIVEAVTKMGITVPSPIQDQIIPEILNGHDVIGLAETGTGKTAAFLLPVLDKTIKEREVRRTTLILAPTRELAIQIEDELKKLTKDFNIYSTVCVGGMNINPQIRGLKRRNHFIIGTPGRVLDLIKRGILKTEEVTTVVLDEADRMLDMGFIHDMKAILKNTPKDRETLFFSATTSKETDNIVNDFLNNPVTISVKKKDVTNSIHQDVVHFKHSSKFKTLSEMLVNIEYKKVLIFGSMKHSVKRLAEELNNAGIPADSIHGNKTHIQRQRSLEAFKKGRVRVLVATDVAARGIHVDEVSHVINYDLPSTFQDYVHRIGRTGRGVNRGKALTFVESR
ncbi:DEAD/DEAH box helicase [Candidatus Pacebacteria bacterium]|nr:DEAD/DEAH box helicase [Candidatus Paceibacterota bacterium]